MFLDDYAAQCGVATRSGVIRIAINELRRQTLVDQYRQAWDEWEGSGEASAWSSTTADGIGGVA